MKRGVRLSDWGEDKEGCWDFDKLVIHCYQGISWSIGITKKWTLGILYNSEKHKYSWWILRWERWNLSCSLIARHVILSMEQETIYLSMAQWNQLHWSLLLYVFFLVNSEARRCQWKITYIFFSYMWNHFMNSDSVREWASKFLEDTNWALHPVSGFIFHKQWLLWWELVLRTSHCCFLDTLPYVLVLCFVITREFRLGNSERKNVGLHLVGYNFKSY